MDFITTAVNEFIRQQREYTERTLAELITKYDFIVGSIECKHKLMEVLPEGANVICSPYVESPTTIYAIKKFDTMDLLSEPHRTDFHYRPKETILDKIRAEIENMQIVYDKSANYKDERTDEEKANDLGKMYKVLVLSIIDKYKAESEEEI